MYHPIVKEQVIPGQLEGLQTNANYTHHPITCQAHSTSHRDEILDAPVEIGKDGAKQVKSLDPALRLNGAYCVASVRRSRWLGATYLERRFNQSLTTRATVLSLSFFLGHAMERAATFDRGIALSPCPS